MQAPRVGGKGAESLAMIKNLGIPCVADIKVTVPAG